MADNRNFAALEWVIHEIEETLKQARQSLEAYVEDPKDTVRIRFCLTHIHQVRGSLQMVEFHGAAMLAEEMEQLTQALIDDRVTNAGEAQEVLMRSLLQFPLYLEQVKSTQKDNPLIVLPLLNDLRAVRGESLLSDTRLFVPDLEPARRVAGERLPVLENSLQFQAMVQKLRQMYQYAAAAYIKAINTDENLAYLKKVFLRLEKLTQGTAKQPLWNICLALSEALEMDAIESSVSIKNLLRQLDKEIKAMVIDGPAVLDTPADEELLKNLLYYVARSGKHAPGFTSDSHLQRIYNLYQLEQALLEGKEAGDASADLLSAPDSAAIRSVSVALKDELDSVKRALDETIGGAAERESLFNVLPVLQRVADTMAVLGFGDLRRRVLEQSRLLENARAQDGAMTDEQLLAAAGNILAIENELDNIADSAGQSARGDGKEGDITLVRAHDSVLRESRNGLEHAKDAIVEYIASQWKTEHLQAVPETLREIRGGLDMMQLSRPGRVLGACARYIEEQLLEQQNTPDWATLDTLADAITSVEYYLERLSSGDTREDTELLLGVAEESMAELGYAVTRFSKPVAPQAPAPSQATSDADVDEAAELSAAYEQAYREAAGDEDAATGEHRDAYLRELAESDTDTVEDSDEQELPETLIVDDVHSDIVVEEEQKADHQEVVPPVVTVEDDEDDIDDEIIEIFVEEAGEVTEAINQHFPRWAQNFSDHEALVEFRRAFHTLKGSGRMVGANDIGELSWSIENMLNRIIDETIAPNNGHIALIERVRHLLPGMIVAFQNKQPNPEPELTATYQSYAAALMQGEMPDALKGELPKFSAPEEQVETDAAVAASQLDMAVEEDDDSDEDGPDVQLWDIFAGEALAHLKEVENYIQRMEEISPFYSPPSDNMQRALHTLKGSAHMADIGPVAELVSPLERFVKELRSYHVNINEDMLQLLRDAVDYIRAGLANIHMGETVAIPKLEQFVARVNELRELYVVPLVRQQEAAADGKRTVDPELLAIFMAEEMNLLLEADQTIEAWQRSPDDLDQLNPLIGELQNLTHGAAHAHLPPMARLGEKLQGVYQLIQQGSLQCSAELGADLNAAHLSLLDMVDAVAAGQNLQDIPLHVEASLDRQLGISAGASSESSEQAEEWPEPANDQDDIQYDLPAEEQSVGFEAEAVGPETADETSEAIEEIEFSLPESDESLPDAEPVPDSDDMQVEAEAAADIPGEEIDLQFAVEEIEGDEPEFQEADLDAEVSATGPVGDDAMDEQDAEIIEIFVEEAVELMEDIERALHDWQEDWSNTECLEELKRSLHTLKGGARLAGITSLGDLAHDFETQLISLGSSDDVDQEFFRRMVGYQDQLISGVDRVRARLAGEPLPPVTPSAKAEVTAAPLPEPDETGQSDRAASGEQANVLPFAPKPKASAPVPAEKPSVPQQPGGLGPVGAHGGQHLATRRSGPQEVIKVSAELLEELVNLAGETSISRGRLEQQVSDVSVAIDEMESTIQRLQEQLRRLDIETEAQIIFRQEQMAAHDEFDPLEMDRYSQLQQLSRSLVESASDLMDLKSTLLDKNRDTETLLLQQSRINTDLQEGLMRSRMVPFSRLVPRLRRIVRQAASELGKEVSFELDNVEGELDRSVLERMVAPLEHMLRNAVDHGIETPAERTAAGKPAAGRIVLSLSREGGDVLIRLADDGRGINLQKVREKAVERGLMSANANLSDQDVMQFILHAGFSTADKVTQISGRGVGMDVVHSEIKQLGGAMFIDSEWGQGTEFLVRLPFTVSVNRALMVQIGDDFYAVPLNSIEGIVRVSPFELEHYYQEEDARFEYAGEQYLVRYLGAMLDSDARPKLDMQALPLPVVLVRSAENTVALQVDRLLGSREIVVKTLGAQFSAVRGVSGATVMGDGSVVVILDLHALIREQLALGLEQATLLEPLETLSAEEDEQEKTVMVVDDSVTVRKVTGRFLEREGYNVITAKDGAEALLLLQDHIPDVMLLDIEMPRMDGFEVAKNIRTSSRLKGIPIIMITSRTGSKHRDRALDLGVDKYMGKPYQEDMLLKNIQELLAKASSLP